MGEFFMSICEHHAIPRPINKLFKDKEIIEFLYTHVSCRVFVVFLHIVTASDVMYVVMFFLSCFN